MTSKSASSWTADASAKSSSACTTTGGGTGGGTGDGAGAADRRRGQQSYCADSDPTFGGDCSSQSDAAGPWAAAPPKQSSHRRRHGKAVRAKHATPPQPKKKPARCPKAEDAPEPPPLWTTTVRVAPPFAGVVPYDPPDAGDRLDGIADAPTIACTDKGDIIYVGMFTDLRERLEIMQTTLDFEGYSLVTEHQRYRNQAEEGEERQRQLYRRLKRLAQLVDERKDRLDEWNKVLRRKPQTS
ncbi:uncharacterized protein LOC134541325 [Bacillus rossius redtenbacheri]|uniref:uncharacterized protein LOC134541325 n=1 Tax=Bacillus rossius redtenbacheri TaxID=93214 RepID=UPI002FDEC1FC